MAFKDAKMIEHHKVYHISRNFVHFSVYLLSLWYGGDGSTWALSFLWQSGTNREVTSPTTDARGNPTTTIQAKESKSSAIHLTPPNKGPVSLDRGTTPERVEFENSMIEHSDEEEYLSEDEWTDRNFGASANELDDDDDDDSDDYSDLR